jgi:hypothetical protein
LRWQLAAEEVLEKAKKKSGPFFGCWESVVVGRLLVKLMMKLWRGGG